MRISKKFYYLNKKRQRNNELNVQVSKFIVNVILLCLLVNSGYQNDPAFNGCNGKNVLVKCLSNTGQKMHTSSGNTPIRRRILAFACKTLKHS